MTTDSSDSQEPVDELLIEYMARLDREEQVDVEEFLSRHPEHADELRELIEADHLLGQLNAPNLHDTVPPTIVPGGNTNDPQPGTRLRYVGDYELLNELARGGMGIVYKARQLSLNRVVAIKMIRSGELAYDDEIQRFQNEAEAVARLQHPNIVSIHEVGQHDGHSYFSMDLVEGRNLSELVREHPLPVREAVRYVKQAAEAIQYAHEQGVLHRDIKPSNILLDTAGQVHITDFGLAKSVASDSSLTHTGQVLGTPSYMPPEQAAGNSALMGPASDVYSLGAVLYELITGRPPFAAATPVETIRQVLDKESLSPRLLNTEVPKDLETICLKCLEKSPTQRYQTGEELVDELDRFLEGKPILARPIGRISRTWRWCRRNLLVAGLAAMFAVSLLAGAVVSMYFAIEAGKRAADADREKLNAQVTERRADARRLASDSVQVLDDFPRRSLLLAIAAVKRTSDHGEPAVQQAEQALRDALGVVGGLGLAQDSPITKMGISPNSRWLVTGSEDGAVRIWDVTRLHESVEPNVTIAATDKVRRIYSISFSPDNKWLVAKTNRGIRLWNLDADVISAKPLTLQSGRSMAISSDSHWLVTGSDSAVRLFDLSLENPADGPVRTIRFNTSNEFRKLCSVKLSPDSRWLGVNCGSNRTGPYVVDLRADNLNAKPIPLDVSRRTKVNTFSSNAGVLFSQDSKWIMQRMHIGIQRWNLTSGEFEYDEIPFVKGHGDPKFSPNSRWVLTRSLPHIRERDGIRLGNEPIQVDQRPHLVDLSAKHPQSVPLELPIENVSTTPESGVWYRFSEDSNYILMGRWPESVVWDLKSGSPVPMPLQFELRNHWPSVFRFSPDGNSFVTVGRDERTALWWDLANMKQSATPISLLGHDDPIKHVIFSPDNRWFITGCTRPRVWTRPVRQGGMQPRNLPRASANIPHYVGGTGRWTEFSEVSGKLIAAVEDATRVWNLERTQLNSIPEPAVLNEWFVSSILMNPKTREYISTSDNGFDPTVRIWGENGTVLNASRGAVTATAVSPDGHWLAAGDDGGAATLWDLTSREPAANPLVFAAHDRPVSALAFSPNGAWMVSISEEKAGFLWRIGARETAERPVSLVGHTGLIRCMAVDPNSNWVVTGGTDGTARMWSLANGNSGIELAVFDGHEGAIQTIAVSPEGQWIATAGDDLTVRLWKTEDQETPAPVELPGHSAEVTSVAFTSDGHWLISGSTDRTARMWNLKSDKIADSSIILRGQRSGIRTLVVNRDSHWLVTLGNDKTALLWDIKASDPAKNPIPVQPNAGDTEMHSAVFDEEKQRIILGLGNREAFLWDLKTQQPGGSMAPDHSGVCFQKLTPNGRHLVSVSAGKARICDLTSDQPRQTLRVIRGTGRYGAGLFHPGSADVSDQWLVTGGRSIRAWKLKEGRLKLPALVLDKNLSWISSISISPDERWIATTSNHQKNPSSSSRISAKDLAKLNAEDKTVWLWRLAGGGAKRQPVILQGHHDKVSNAVFSPDGLWIATSGKGTRGVSQPSADSVMGEMDRRPDPTVSSAFLWKLSLDDPSAKPIALDTDDENVTSIKFSSDSRWLAAVCDDQAVRLWKLSRSGTTRRFVLRGHRDEINSLAFSPDNHWLVSTSSDSTACLWDLSEAAPDANVTVLRGHRDRVNSAVFSPDSSRLFTGSQDRSARIWDLTADDPSIASVVLGGDTRETMVSSVEAVSPDGRFLVSHGFIGIQVWNLRINELVDLAKRVAGKELTKEERTQYSVIEANE